MSSSSPHTGLDPARRRWAILAVGLALTLSVIDSSIANVALPTIAGDLQAQASFAIWIVNAYQMAIMLSLLPLAALGDIVGYSRVYLAGLVVFTIASLVCSLSSTLSMLVAARVLQGFGAAGLMSVNMAVVRFIYPTSQLGRGIGINALIIAVAAAAGPTIASAILAVAPWPWLFAINVPLGIAAVTIGFLALPVTPRSRHPFDFVSAALSAVCFGLLISLIGTLGHRSDPLLVLAQVAVTAGSGYVLYRRQAHSPAPLLPIDLLRIPIFALSIGTSMSSFVAQTLALISLPFFLQGNIGFTAVETGLLMTPWPIATSVMAPIAGRLSDRHPAGLLGLIGLLVFAAGLAVLALIPPDASIWNIAWRMAVAGAGFGLYQAPNNRAMISAAPRARSGGAAGMQGMARLFGQTTGASLAALFFSLMAQHQATVFALWIGVCFSTLAAGVSALRLTEPTKPKS